MARNLSSIKRNIKPRKTIHILTRSCARDNGDSIAPLADLYSVFESPFIFPSHFPIPRFLLAFSSPTRFLFLLNSSHPFIIHHTPAHSSVSLCLRFINFFFLFTQFQHFPIQHGNNTY